MVHLLSDFVQSRRSFSKFQINTVPTYFNLLCTRVIVLVMTIYVSSVMRRTYGAAKRYRTDTVRTYRMYLIVSRVHFFLVVHMYS
jgi:hypothetical protein